MVVLVLPRSGVHGDKNAIPYEVHAMCGRFVRAKASETYGDLFGVQNVPDFTASYNIAPMQQVLAARIEGDAKMCVGLRWGLIPSRAKDRKANFFNARADTLFELPSFRTSAKRRRCLIFADGYFEWKQIGPKTKQKYYFRMIDDRPFAFAGIWDTWSGDGIESCSIVTTHANELSSAIHDRMPVILRGNEADTWIDPEVENPKTLAMLLKPFPAGQMTCYPVGKVMYDSPACIEPVAARVAAAQGTLF
jgi:putative SOS response-associated peptidase YedK